ncbi:hypothetical protein Taro_003933 [Colocasia esculenta]|uniref:Uncharacterized protein n=1 Tax=Colocasia esculenta TaxID=4460 RepID=A0A843TN57_COLES|nr:hypothetical protein [Colocasia esculenta]
MVARSSLTSASVGVPATLVGKVASFPARSKCELQESVAAVAGWRRDLRGPWWGSGRSGHCSGIRAQRSNEICIGLITMVVPKKGTSTLLARPCRVLLGSECELQKSVVVVAGWRQNLRDPLRCTS